MVGLGDLAGGTFFSRAEAASVDGSVIVGWSASDSGFEAFRWTEADGMVGLGDLAGGSFLSRARDVSADGSVVVGTGESDAGVEGFRWTESGGMEGLGALTRAEAVSSDGSVIVGWGEQATRTEAFRWTELDGLVGLGDLPGGRFFSRASAVSADGSVIIGWSESASGLEPFVWDDVNGMQELDELLTALGADLMGWTLIGADSPTDVSDDGSVIVGQNINPSGDTEAWIAALDCDADDADCDGVLDTGDNCPVWANPEQDDTDENDIGDACECGDQNGDGTVNVTDILAINAAIFTPALATPLCDTNDDQNCDVQDILGVNGKIFGADAFCSRFPTPVP
jgi:probable HAF family extracellular repeat protein